MLEPEHNGFHPLTPQQIDAFVPARPGVYMLGIRLVNGVHRTFFTSQSENLFVSLRKLADGDDSQLSPAAKEHMGKNQCYFNYYVVPTPEQRGEIEKMLAQTTDPVVRLTIVMCN